MIWEKGVNPIKRVQLPPKNSKNVVKKIIINLKRDEETFNVISK